MIAHRGENVFVCSVFQPTSGSFNLADYDVVCIVSNIKGKEVIKKRSDIIRNNEDNAVGCTLTATDTKALNGLYFVSFELWANGQKVLSNEVEQITFLE
jgi:hypothetical protein